MITKWLSYVTSQHHQLRYYLQNVSYIVTGNTKDIWQGNKG